MRGRTFLEGRHIALCVAAWINITLFAGCSSVTESRPRTPEAARVLVTGSSTVPLTLVTSTQFTITFDAQGDEVLTLLAADTADLDLPIDRTIPFGAADRIFVQLTNPDPAVDATVDMRVLFDGIEAYRQAATLKDASLSFRYLFF